MPKWLGDLIGTAQSSLKRSLQRKARGRRRSRSNCGHQRGRRRSTYLRVAAHVVCGSAFDLAAHRMVHNPRVHPVAIFKTHAEARTQLVTSASFSLLIIVGSPAIPVHVARTAVLYPRVVSMLLERPCTLKDACSDFILRLYILKSVDSSTLQPRVCIALLQPSKKNKTTNDLTYTDF